MNHLIGNFIQDNIRSSFLKVNRSHLYTPNPFECGVFVSEKSAVFVYYLFDDFHSSGRYANPPHEPCKKTCGRQII